MNPSQQGSFLLIPGQVTETPENMKEVLFGNLESFFLFDFCLNLVQVPERYI